MAEKKPAKKAVQQTRAKRTAKAASASTATPTATGTSATKRPAGKQAASKQPAKQTTKKTTTKTAKKTATKTATKQTAKATTKQTAKATKTAKATTRQTTENTAAPEQAPTAVREATEQMPEQLAERASALAVRDDESPWSPDELSEVLAALTADADRLRTEILDVENELDDMLHNSGEGAGDDQADAGSKTFEREHEMSLVANARDMLTQTERAIHRIQGGTYGNCEGCDRAIGKERLRAYPRATLCVACKQREERR